MRSAGTARPWCSCTVTTTPRATCSNYAELIHDRYNVVLFDLRNHGRSQAMHTAMGVREQDDVSAVLDWLAREKAPQRVGLSGLSMGGVTALNVAAGDGRVAAVAVDSTHATIGNTIEARLRNQRYPLTLPGYWAVILGTWVRTGAWIPSADAVDAVEDLGD
ncbi:MAG: alpha/beta hydrolase [Candidatus Limnocylindria bacterium]